MKIVDIEGNERNKEWLDELVRVSPRELPNKNGFVVVELRESLESQLIVEVRDDQGNPIDCEMVAYTWPTCDRPLPDEIATHNSTGVIRYTYVNGLTSLGLRESEGSEVSVWVNDNSEMAKVLVDDDHSHFDVVFQWTEDKQKFEGLRQRMLHALYMLDQRLKGGDA